MAMTSPSHQSKGYNQFGSEPSAPPPPYASLDQPNTGYPPQTSIQGQANHSYGIVYPSTPAGRYDVGGGGVGAPYGAYPGGGGGVPYGAYPTPAASNVVDIEPSSESIQTNNWNASSFSDKRIRMAFIRKVYLILLAQLVFTFGIICLFVFCAPVRTWLRSGTNQAFYWVSYGVFIVTYFVLVCIPSVRRKVPGNYICLTVFTIAFTYLAATISSFHSTYIVLVAIGITLGLCLAISLFAIQTKIDFTMCSGLLFALCMVVFLFGISVLICYLVTGNSFASYVMNCVYGGLAALLFGLFLIYDTQMLIGGRKYELGEEEYIFGALQLYMDVVYLFIIILSLFGGSSK